MHLVRRTIERYVPLSDGDWEVIEPRWEPRSFAKGELISVPGRTEQYFHIVERGVQRLFVPYDGQEVCLGFSYDGSWSGDYDSFLRREGGRFAVQAITPSLLWGVTYADLKHLYEVSPPMERFGRRILEELLIGRATREVEQLTLSAEQRFEALMRRSPHLLQLVPQKDIASYLRMTPETFSRLRAKRKDRAT
jgi:CRP/FNR family transcriptional regulator, anaerobic regulatory protein